MGVDSGPSRWTVNGLNQTFVTVIMFSGCTFVCPILVNATSQKVPLCPLADTVCTVFLSGCCQASACELIFSLCFIFQYRIGQLYMISKHSHEQSDRGEGVEVVQNEPYEDPAHGQGQFTEKRVYLNRSVEHVPDSLLSIM